MTVIAAERATGRSLISAELFDRLVNRVVTSARVDRRFAERIQDQALAFLAACAWHTDITLRPSELVDHGWHAFLLYTREFAQFCDQVAGRFIHHIPDDTPQPASTPSAGAARTIAAIHAAGYLVDPELWPISATCNSDRCSGSGREGNENTDTQIPPPADWGRRCTGGGPS
jgi:hypothetical protein